MQKKHLYQEIAEDLALQIKSNILLEGERLPSVRMLCQEYGISMNTAKRVYLELEEQFLIESKPQSGYFVTKKMVELPLANTSNPILIANEVEPDHLAEKVYANLGNEKLTLFSVNIPSADLLPLAKMNKQIVQATRNLKEGGLEYESIQGNLNLRRMIAVRSLSWAGNLQEEDLITTTGGINALSLSLMAVSKPGDTLAIESPCYPGILQLAISLGLKVLELPTHPTTGIIVESLIEALPKIDICLLVSNFNTPTGSCMPDEHKEEVVELLAKHNIPLIEDDVYGDLYIDEHRPKCCKSFDKTGNVLWCSSVSKTLAPGYRVGWVAPGKFKEKVIKLKYIHCISTASIVEEAVANFLREGRYDLHLQKLRKVLQENHLNYVRTIVNSFPKGTKTSRPQGGLALWVEFESHIDTIKLYDLAIQENISIAPGRMFSLQNQFTNCMRLCLGLKWSDRVEQKLKRIGQLAKKLQ